MKRETRGKKKEEVYRVGWTRMNRNNENKMEN
jgi:hypothetical protein